MPYKETYGSQEKNLAEAIVDEQIARGASGGGGGGGTGGGDASAFNQRAEITEVTSINNRLPSSFGASGGVRVDADFTEISNRLGATTDPAAASAVAASGLLGLVRFLFGLLPPSLAGDRFKVESVVKTVSPAIITESALSAPGATPTQSMEGYYKATYQINALGITNAVLRMEGNCTGTEFANLNESGSDKTITTAGIYLFKFEGLISNVRMNLVSVAGSAPSIIAHLKKGN